RELWEATPGATFFQSWDWLRSYWRLNSEGQRLRVLLFTLRARPIGIVPLVVRPIQTPLGQTSALTWPINDHGAFYGAIGPNPAATLTAAFRYLTSARRDWSVIDLPHIDEFGADNGRTRNAMRNARLRARQTNMVLHPMVDLSESWDCYLDELPLKSRAKYIQAEQLALQYGKLSFHRWRPEGNEVGKTERRRDLFDQLRELKRRTAKTSEAIDRELSLIEDVHPAAVDAGVVDLCTLCVGGVPAAGTYGYRMNGTLELLFVEAPGNAGELLHTVLMSHLIRDSFMRNDERILFQPRNAPAAKLWANSAAAAVTLSRFAKLSPKAQSLKLNRGTGPDFEVPRFEFSRPQSIRPAILPSTHDGKSEDLELAARKLRIYQPS
ncbi:GNAT family N-acetyltransferase, partial [bacterium]|nr:GNAT family N-acetyltransferase [bacterium]